MQLGSETQSGLLPPDSVLLPPSPAMPPPLGPASIGADVVPESPCSPGVAAGMQASGSQPPPQQQQPGACRPLLLHVPPTMDDELPPLQLQQAVPELQQEEQQQQRDAWEQAQHPSHLPLPSQVPPSEDEEVLPPPASQQQLAAPIWQQRSPHLQQQADEQGQLQGQRQFVPPTADEEVPVPQLQSKPPPHSQQHGWELQRQQEPQADALRVPPSLDNEFDPGQLLARGGNRSKDAAADAQQAVADHGAQEGGDGVGEARERGDVEQQAPVSCEAARERQQAAERQQEEEEARQQQVEMQQQARTEYAAQQQQLLLFAVPKTEDRGCDGPLQGQQKRQRLSQTHELPSAAGMAAAAALQAQSDGTMVAVAVGEVLEHAVERATAGSQHTEMECGDPMLAEARVPGLGADPAVTGVVAGLPSRQQQQQGHPAAVALEPSCIDGVPETLADHLPPASEVPGCEAHPWPAAGPAPQWAPGGLPAHTAALAPAPQAGRGPAAWGHTEVQNAPPAAAAVAEADVAATPPGVTATAAAEAAPAPVQTSGAAGPHRTVEALDGLAAFDIVVEAAAGERRHCRCLLSRP